jgi:hypothetical protein
MLFNIFEGITKGEYLKSCISKFKVFTLIIICNLASSMVQASIPESCLVPSHDITTLHKWGPYSKRYAGISHIPDLKTPLRFDFSVMPGYYRNSQLIPHVLFESGYYPWEINPAMDRITYRYELEWKDMVYTDVTYHLIDSTMTLVEIECVNRTSAPQNIVLNLMSYIDYEKGLPSVEVKGIAPNEWHSFNDYVLNEPVIHTPQYRLSWDGNLRNEVHADQSVSGYCLGGSIGRDKGHKLVYAINLPSSQRGVIAIRHKTPVDGEASFALSGISSDTLRLRGTGEFTMDYVPFEAPAGKSTLTMTSLGTSSTVLDGFFLSEDTESLKKVTFEPRNISFTPIIHKSGTNQDFILKFPMCDNFYGVAWNYTDSEIREILDDNLESFFRKKTHDHVSSRLHGNHKWHYTDGFLRPVVLKPESSQRIYALLSTGENKEPVERAIQKFHVSEEDFVDLIPKKDSLEYPYLEGSEKYAHGIRLLQAALLSNTVFPVRTQGEYIRHFTPGKNWNSLYTWDSGFIALGLADVDIVKAFECIRAYTTSPGCESAFIHHGTPLPIQIFAWQELWNMTQSEDALNFLYPRLKQYYDFLAGHDSSSSTLMKESKLLRTWDYFYNSGGWDDYPPQKALPDKKTITPVVNTAYTIRAARILRQMALHLGAKKDARQYETDIRTFSNALDKYAWDEESGYYGYVRHDSLGHPCGIFRYSDGSNFNCGIDGISPLVAGTVSPDRANRLVGHIFSSSELWTDLGISTVAQNTKYYKSDGYWNGAVWMPHQWMIWKTMLDLGEPEKAWRIASTALETWERECSRSYFTFEHFIISSGRGAGWHQFSGLSSPLLGWFAAYYRVGRVSTGFEIWLKSSKFNDNHTSYQADIVFDTLSANHQRSMLVCMNPEHKYEVRFRGKPQSFTMRHPGLLEITLPISYGGELTINPLSL